MREIIAGIAFLLSFFVLLVFIFAFIFPSKLAMKGGSIPTRKEISISGIFLFSILFCAGLFILPNENEQSASLHVSEIGNFRESDIEKLKQLHTSISATENTYSEQMGKFSSVLQRLYLKERVSDLERSKPVATSFGEMIETLDKAKLLKSPDFHHPDANRYAINAVEAHKKWALMTQARLAALAIGNMDQAQSMSAKADSFAMDEALALQLAYSALDLPIH